MSGKMDIVYIWKNKKMTQDNIDKQYLAKAHYWASQLPKRKPKKKVNITILTPNVDKEKYKRQPNDMIRISKIVFCKKINFYNKGE